MCESHYFYYIERQVRFAGSGRTQRRSSSAPIAASPHVRTLHRASASMTCSESDDWTYIEPHVLGWAAAQSAPWRKASSLRFIMLECDFAISETASEKISGWTTGASSPSTATVHRPLVAPRVLASLPRPPPCPAHRPRRLSTGPSWIRNRGRRDAARVSLLRGARASPRACLGTSPLTRPWRSAPSPIRQRPAGLRQRACAAWATRGPRRWTHSRRHRAALLGK